MVQTTNEKLVFAVAPSGTGDNVPIVIVGVPADAWKYMSDGKTHHFDLTSVGLPVKFMLFGADDHDSALRVLQEAAAARGMPLQDLRRRDFSIKPGSTE